MLREGLRLLRRCWLALLLYGALAHAVAGLVLAPLLFWLLNKGLHLAHSGPVVNFDLTAFFLSVPGIALGVTWAAIIGVLAIVALGGGVFLTHAAWRGERVGATGLARRVLGVLPRMVSLGVVRLALLVVVLVPALLAVGDFLVGRLVPALYEAPIIPFVEEIRSIPLVVPIAAALLIGALLLAVRYAFVLHVLCLEGTSLRQAFASSAELTRGRFRSLALSLGGALLLVLLATGLIALGFAFGIGAWLAALESEGAFVVAVSSSIVLFTVVTSAAVTLGIGWIIAVITADYAARRNLGPANAPRPAVARRARGWLVAGGGALAAATALTIPRVTEGLDGLERKVAITAHRGASAEAPENTISALRQAVEDRADFAEIDVQQTKDAAIVMLHDTNLKRVAGVDREVYDMTLAELKALDFGGWFDERFKGERIATLEEVLDYADGRLKLNIELKVHGHEQQFAERVVKLLRARSFAGQCVITSLDLQILRQVRGLAPELKIGAIVTAKLGRLGDLDVDFYSMQPLLATVPKIRRAHAMRREVHVWTINEPDKMRRIIDRGIDNLITDHPRRARAVLDDRDLTDDLRAAVRRLFR